MTKEEKPKDETKTKDKQLPLDPKEEADTESFGDPE